MRLDHQNDALFAVQQARVLIRTSTWQRFDALLLSIEAEAASRVGDEVKAVTLIREMLPLTRNRIVAACLLELCDWVSRQLAQALKAGIEVEAARALIQAFELSPQTPLDEHWPWPVKIFLLGRFEILHNDAPIVATRKTPKKPLALLKALVCGGGSAVSIAQLIDWLWPDSEADAAKKAFEMALLRLRALLGGNHTLKLENGRLSLDRSTIWVDAWAFDALAQQTTNDANQLARAVQLYAGSLLPHDLDAAWALSYRERLRDSFKRLICNLATDLEATQRYAEALALYARGLEADDLVESMYQGAMRCHLNLGRRAEALATFQRLRRTLTAKLRTLPSTESVTLASAAET